MKEVTYEAWQNNPTPRMMWVWDNNEEDKLQRKVIYFLDPKCPYLVVALAVDGSACNMYKHCAEIKKQRQMTNKELSRWLREKTTREWKYKHVGYVYSFYSYTERGADEEVCDRILIREDDGEWREPLVEE